jgi:hypothetical protein
MLSFLSIGWGVRLDPRSLHKLSTGQGRLLPDDVSDEALFTVGGKPYANF